MATQEVTIRFKGDPANLRAALSEVRTDYARTTTEMVSRIKSETISRAQQGRQLVADVKRFERERQQVATEVSRAIERQAKSEADQRIREGRRAANALIASLREEAREVARIQQAQVGQRSRTGAFAAGAAGGITALVGLSAANEIREAGAAWLDYASKLETTKIAFTTMLGSAELAQAHLNELQQFALKTPFQFAELIDASQRMQALGFNAQQVVPILTDVGNAVAAAGGGSERLDRVVLALSQMQSKGKVATQELNQLAEAGINGFKILEQQTGKSRAELVKMVEQGQISSALFLDAFQKFSQQNFGGLMEQQSKTFTGAMSNIKDALLQTSATAFQPLYDRLTQLAKQMADTSTKSNEFKENMKVVGAQLATVFDGIVKAVHLVRDAIGLAYAAIVAQIEITRHAVLSLAAAFGSQFYTADALSKLLLGNLVGAYASMDKAQAAAKISADEMKATVFAMGGVYREVENVIARFNQRVLESGATTAIAAAQMAASLAAGKLQGGDVSVGAGIIPRATQTVPAIPTSPGRAPSGASERDRTLEREISFHKQLNTELVRTQAEYDGINVRTRAYSVSQEILNGALAKSSPLMKEIALGIARGIDDLKERIEAQRTLAGFEERQAEAVRLVLEGEQSQLRIAQDLNKSLEKQGLALSDTTKFWLQFRATILDANTASERLTDTLESLREAATSAIDAVPLPELDKGAIGRQIAAEIGEPPPPPDLTPHIDQVAILRGAYEDLAKGIAQGIGSVIQNFVLLGNVGPQAFRKVLASALATVAAQAGAQAIYELALGFAALTPWGAAIYGPAALHFKAAALLGSIALVSGAAGRLAAGGAFQSASGGGGAAGGAASSPTSLEPREPQPIDINRRPGQPSAPLPPIQVHVTVVGQATEGFTYMVEKAVVDSYRGNGKVYDVLGHAQGRSGFKG